MMSVFNLIVNKEERAPDHHKSQSEKCHKVNIGNVVRQKHDYVALTEEGIIQ